MSNLRRLEQALSRTGEAVDLYRRLAAANPHAFEPDLTTSLHNGSVCLAELNRRWEALAAIDEAIELRRRLAVLYPEAFTHDLNQSL